MSVAKIGLAVHERQNRFHEMLVRYANGAMFTNSERLTWNVLTARRTCEKYAPYIRASYANSRTDFSRGPAHETRVTEKIIEPYTGTTSSVLRLKGYLQQHVDSDIHIACLHGSLGDDTQVAYSDFDALIVLKNTVFESEQRIASTVFHLISAKRYLVEFDPLQHHGFFVLLEEDFGHYCDSYFPAVLYDHAKSILGHEDKSLQIRCRDSQPEATESLRSMLATVDHKLKRKQFPRNYYELKLLLSQVMLIPSLYLQYKGKPVFKRDSFRIARRDFNPEVWSIMDDISHIRLNWDYRPNSAVRWIQRMTTNPFLSTIYQKKIGQKISRDLSELLTHEFYERIVTFTQHISVSAGLECCET